ncbi:recombinase family protein [Nocardioides sp. W3-2-3]|uniref:recombinase family protein n=1 Tax=Nocardioides convexus TaxID=2712224 RepID=UPI00241863BA|nr:recombinase family protein [Nocardioides convexus]NHA01883.1 recombinase family protein [Nocardioides convexus]
MERAVIYCRISNDPEGRELGVRRQEADCRALAARLGLDVARVYVENDVSASTLSTKPRPQYKAMLAAIDAGEAAVILAYSNSRLTRRPLEWLNLIERANAGRLRIETVVSGSHDLTTADGRALAITVAAWDAAEAERTSERARRAKAQAVAEGRYRGGPRPFGYEADGVTLRPAEADLVRQATRDLLAGRSLAAIAREWTAAGMIGTKGRPFNATRVRRVLQRARNAGLVESAGDVIGPGAWPSIVSEAEWRACQAVLTDPSRRTTPGPERRWLGSGIYRCGDCGDGLIVTGSKGRKVYRCRDNNHVTRNQPNVDEYVTAVVREYLNDPGLRERLRPDPADATEVEDDRLRTAELRNRLTVFEADYAAGDITGRQLREATQRIEAEVAVIAEREAARWRGSAFGDLLAAPDPAAAFDTATLDRQRAVLAALVTVTINRGRRGRPPGWVAGMPYTDLSSVVIRGREAVSA